MALPPGLRKGITSVLEAYPLDTVGDILFAEENSEAQAFVYAQDDAVRSAWAKAVTWAKAKSVQTELRIYDEGLRGTGPLADFDRKRPQASSASKPCFVRPKQLPPHPMPWNQQKC